MSETAARGQRTSSVSLEDVHYADDFAVELRIDELLSEDQREDLQRDLSRIAKTRRDVIADAANVLMH